MSYPNWLLKEAKKNRDLAKRENDYYPDEVRGERMKSLIIWLKDGQTMKFEDVKYFEIDNRWVDTITFNYHGVSTNVRRDAVFNIDNIAGYAIESEETE